MKADFCEHCGRALPRAYVGRGHAFCDAFCEALWIEA
jgi:hypothetical protein